jgi:hybrid cluster-associated redox disulfide protein
MDDTLENRIDDMERPAFSSELSVEQILADWPQTLPVFIRFHMLCIGCPVTPFHTLRDACLAHDIDLEPFESALEAVVNSDLPQSPKGGAAAGR